MIVCDVCAEVVPDSNHGRGAHQAKCGRFTSRNTRIAAQRNAYTSQPGAGGAEEEAPRPHQNPAPRRSYAHKALTMDQFLGERPPTVRYLKRYGWEVFRERVMTTCLRGYSVDALEQRCQRQLRMTEVVRSTLYKAGAPRQGEGASGGGEAERIEALVEIGAVGKAARGLFAAISVKEVDEQCLADLVALHPEGAPIDSTQRPFADLPGINEECVKKCIVRRLARGAAPAMDGWTRELLLPLVHDAEALRELTAMVGDLINGRTTDEVMQRLLASPLIPLSKEGGGTRPIAIESTIVKLMAHLGLQRISNDTWKECFPAMQMGVGPAANVEAAVHLARKQLATHGHAIAIDCSNAYNTVHREAIWRAVTANDGLWPIQRLAAWSLRPTHLCVMSAGQTVRRMRSAQGVRQGSVLGPLLFSLAIQPTLVRVRNTVDVEITAYLDDITVSGKPLELQKAFDATADNLMAIGLMVNVAKTTFISSSASHIARNGTQALAPNAGVVKVMGAAMQASQHKEQQSAYVLQRMKKYEGFFSALSQSPAGLWARMAILQKCGVPRANFLLRTHEPDVACEAAVWFDSTVEATLRTMTGADALTSDIAGLPERMGGLGLRPQTDLLEFAYETSRDGLKGRQRDLSEQVDLSRLDGILAQMPERDAVVRRSFLKAPLRALQLSDEAMRGAVRERMFLPTVAEGVCACGSPLDTYHLQACAHYSAARISRHDRIVHVLARAAERRFATRVEPARLVPNSRERPDLRVLMVGGDLTLDVAVAFVGSVTGPNALDKKAKEKTTKYATVEGFKPFVVGHTGELHSAAEEILEKIVPSRPERDEVRALIRRAVFEGNAEFVRAAQTRRE